AINGIVPPSNEPDPGQWQDVSVSYESAHPYVKNTDQTVVIEQPGAKYIRVYFDLIDTEARYDVVSVESDSGEVMDSYSGKQVGVLSEAVAGSRAVVRLKSDDSIDGWGYKISRIQVIR
ncbi:MAG: hypothetical protein RJB38_462, partial [Pseudomonadota bacterium]